MKHILKIVYWVFAFISTFFKASSFSEGIIILLLFGLGYYIIRGIYKSFTSSGGSNRRVGPPEDNE